jgi:hypothetical protein
VTELTPASDRGKTIAWAAPPQILPRVDGNAIAASAGIAAVAALRVVLLFRYRIDSDETQHLHVAWGWANGLLPYRDVFDNHMPLFHILFAPLVAAVGERTQLLFVARVAMLPLFAAMALLTWRIGSAVWPQRVAAWATLIGCVVPDFFLCSLEFRTDDLWAACWLACIALLVLPALTFRRVALAGLMLGLAAGVSAKTSLLAACLAVAAVATCVVMRDGSRLIARAAVFVGAAAVPPALIGAWFALHGAWQPFLHCTVLHNLVRSEHPMRVLLLPVSLTIIVLTARRILRHDAPAAVRKRRLFLFLTASTYGAALVSLWPILETEHWLPFHPLAAAAIVPLLLPAGGLPLRRISVAVAALELLRVVQLGTPWRDNTAPSVQLIARTLLLTAPREHVVDLKGEMIFRPRATYYVFEKITKRAITHGRLRDTIAADVLRTGAMVAVRDNESFPRDGRAFLNRNFLRVGELRVAGLMVPCSGSFRIEVPGEYSVVAERGAFHGSLDGTVYRAPRYLAPGTHTLTAATAVRTSVLWQRAAAQGMTPWLNASTTQPLNCFARSPSQSAGSH